MSSSPFPSFPVSGIEFPATPLTIAAYNYVKENCSACTLNHCLRSTAFGLILQKKFPPLAGNQDALDKELIVVSTLLHDMGWATNKALISKDKRFEVDGANVAREFILKRSEPWDKHRVQLMWDAIALHTTPSIAHHKEPEVLGVQLGIFADFMGFNLPIPGVVSVDEYKEVVQAFPRLGFKDELIKIMCGLCHDKPETTHDNFVSMFGMEYGLDGKGRDREEFTKTCRERSIVKLLVDDGLGRLAPYDV
jgi:hypothetical protein